MDIAREYAEYCTDFTLNSVEGETVECTKKLIIDSLGLAIGSYTRTESASVIHESVRDLLGHHDTGATVLATGDQYPAAYAALLNGAMIHSLDFDDTHAPGSIHPGCSIIPAALAMAEKTNASGKRFIEGVIAGYDVACNLAMSLNPPSPYELGVHPTGVCGVFGATAAAGVLNDLSPDQLESAFGINGSQASGSQQFLKNGAWNKRLHPGFAARSGIFSVILANNGFIGAESPIEGNRAGIYRGYTTDPHPELATATLGTEYEVNNTAMKPYPCCRLIHAPLEIITEIKSTTDVDAESVTSIDITVSDLAVDVTATPIDKKRNPRTFVDAQFSLPFAVALALTVDEIDVDTYINTATTYDKNFQRLMDRTNVHEGEDIDALLTAKVELVTDDDTHVRRISQRNVKGEPDNPMTWNECRTKFSDLTEFTQSSNDQVLSTIDRLERNDTEDIVKVIAEAS